MLAKIGQTVYSSIQFLPRDAMLRTVLNEMFWRQTRLQLQTNLRLYQTCILSILLDGSETWTLLQEDLRKLEVFQVRSQRMILGSQDTLV